MSGKEIVQESKTSNKRKVEEKGPVNDDHESDSVSVKRARKRPEFLHEDIASGKQAKGSKCSSSGSSHYVAHLKIQIFDDTEPLPSRDAEGKLHFADYPEFTPNLTPKEVLQRGSFGGTYFRVITSGVTGETYHDAWKEFPADWFEGLNIKRHVASAKYQVDVNTYRETCGGDLNMWESSGWITEADPFGWFQWYCRFYLGRRCSDDARQVGRALGVMGPTGRWRRSLENKCLASNKPLEKAVDDVSISPKIRQLLQHWGYKPTLRDLQQAARKNK